MSILTLSLTLPLFSPASISRYVVSDQEFTKKIVNEKPALPIAVSPNKKIASILKDNRTDIHSERLIKVADTIYSQSMKYGYDPLFVLAIIKTESSFRNQAVSRRGARGLMQIVPATAEEIARKKDMDWQGHSTLHIPWSNVKMGTYYFSKLLKRFDGNVEVALEAYNYGPTKISRWIRRGRSPVFSYSKKVLGNYRILKKTYGEV